MFLPVDKLFSLIYKVEMELRNLGFGYRAKFIQKSAEQIVEWGKDEWFKGLENMKYKEAREELMKLHGIGPKVNYYLAENYNFYIIIIYLHSFSLAPVTEVVSTYPVKNIS